MRLATQAKFRAVAVELEGMIREGKWLPDQKLPSVRAIAEEHSVALATAARALEVLNGKGLIQANERSGVYRVVDTSASANRSNHWAVCLRITPGPWQRASMAVTGSGFLDLAQTPRVRLDFDAIPTDLDLPEATLRQMVRRALQKGVTGVFFLPSRISETLMHEDERLLSICRDFDLPAVLIERNLRGEHRALEWDLVCPDDFDGGFQCAMHLFANGRTRLAFVRGGPTSSHNDQMAGFLAAHFQARQRGLVRGDQAFPLILEYPEGSASKEAYRSLCDQILENKIDGVVCYHDRMVVGLTMELLARGKRVPDDVAMTGFDDQPICQEFAIGVTTYAYPGREIVSRASQVMRERTRNPSAPPIKVLVPSRLIIRESSATAIGE